MNVLLFGATGKTGAHVLKKMLDKGYQVSVFARSPEKLDMTNEHLTVIKGDANDASLVDQAMPGHDLVISCLGSNTGLGKTTELHKMASNIAKSMKKHAVKRIIYVASAGIDKEIPGMMGKITMKLLGNVLEDHRNAVQAIKDAELCWTIVRPLGLNDKPATLAYRETEEGIPQNGRSISREDVADFIMRAAEDEMYQYKSVAISD